MCEPRRQARSDRNRHREDGEIERDHAGGATDIVFRERRQHRQDYDADQPEPTRHQGAPPQPPIAAHVFDQVDRRSRDVGIDLETRRAFAGARDEQTRDPAGGSRHQHEPGEVNGIAAVAGSKAGHDGPDQNGDERSAFDQRVASGEFFTLQMIRQDAVFDRAEHRRDDAVEKDRQKQQGDRMKPEAHHGHDGDRDFEQLQSAGHDGLIEAVGNLAAETGKKEERKCESRGRELDQRAGFGLAELDQEDEDQRLLQEVVTERGEGLAPKQRRKTSRRHQGRGHRSPPFDSRFRGGILDAWQRIGDVL